jgi:hypothetical protein
LAALARTFDVDCVLARGNLFLVLDFRFVVMIEKRREASVDPAAAGRQTSFGRHSGQRGKRTKENKATRQKSPGQLPVALQRRASVVG